MFGLDQWFSKSQNGMERTDVAYLINSTPKYFYLLPLHLTLLQRYASTMLWPIYLATEEPDHHIIQKLKEQFPRLRIIPLTLEQEGFLDSRYAACMALPSSIRYVFPIQEDFLLEGRPMTEPITEVLQFMDKDTTIQSVRLMPCPGPGGPKGPTDKTRYKTSLLHILESNEMIFTYQATLWRRDSYQNFMQLLCEYLNSMRLTQEQKNNMAIRQNIAEVSFGQDLLKAQGGIHLAWPREGSQPNAVYLCPWPYRPTAIVQGKLQPWAEDLADREKVMIRFLPSLR